MAIEYLATISRFRAHYIVLPLAAGLQLLHIAWRRRSKSSTARKCQQLQLRIPCSSAASCGSRQDTCVCVHVLPHDVDACNSELTELMPDLLANEVLGLDCEWQPERGPGVHNRVAVVQLSSASHCIILQPLLMGCLSPDDPRKAATSFTAATTTRTTTTLSLADVENGCELAASGPGGVLDPDQVPELPGDVSGRSACIPAALRALLEDPGIIKAGVGIAEDVRRLRQDYGICVKGALDLRVALQSLAPQHLVGGASLQALAWKVLGVMPDKSLQCSDWQRPGLTKAQLEYAAQDAWLSRQLAVALFQELGAGQSNGSASGSEATATSSSGNPPSCNGNGAGCHAGNATSLPSQGQLQEQTPSAAKTTVSPGLRSMFMPFVDRLKAPAAPGAGFRGVAGPGNGSPFAPTPSKPAKPINMPTRKTELYENCRLLAPDGGVLCTCSRKKIQWYVDRGLADLVCQEPPAARLKFEPQGRGNVDDKYYLSDKVNRCCVCGKEGDYLRHSIVPHCYRSQFPVYMKSHLSHDVVLLCQGCQHRCCSLDQARMAALGQQYDAPLGGDNNKFEQDFGTGSVKSAARALASTKVILPAGRRAELEAVVLEYFGAEEVTAELLSMASELQPKKLNAEWKSHASIVVSKVLELQGIDDFVRGWRQHFLDTMKPGFLPPHWSINSRVANSSAHTMPPAALPQDDHPAV